MIALADFETLPKGLAALSARQRGFASRSKRCDHPRAEPGWRATCGATAAQLGEGSTMWQVKTEQYSTGRHASIPIDFIENENGVRLVLRHFDGRIEQDMEVFDYVAGSIRFQLLATRVDQQTLKLQDHYTVWLGIALQTASIRASPELFTLEHARTIARDIKGALLVWRPPGRLSEILGVTAPARDVRFVMTRWDKWDPAHEGDWP
jgi:hypothetical protein